jgi:hypothetical protein
LNEDKQQRVIGFEICSEKTSNWSEAYNSEARASINYTMTSEIVATNNNNNNNNNKQHQGKME